MSTVSEDNKSGGISIKLALILLVVGIVVSVVGAFLVSGRFSDPSNEFGVSLQVQVFTSLLIFGVLLSVITIALFYWLGRGNETVAAPVVAVENDDKQARIDTLMRAVDGALIATDSHGRILFMNTMATGIFQCHKKKVEGAMFDELCTLTERRPNGEEHRLKLVEMRKGSAVLETECQDWQVPVNYNVTTSVEEDLVRMVVFQPQREAVPAHLNQVFDNAFEEIYTVSADNFRIRRVNNSLCRNLQISSVEAQLLGLADIVEELNVEVVRDLFTPLREGAKNELRLSLHHKRKDGTSYPVETKIVYGEDERNNCYYVFAEDITEREQSHEQLVKSNELLHELKQLASVGTWELDLRSKIFTWSPEIYRIVGIDEAETSPPVTKLLLRVHPEDKQIVDEALFSSFDDESKYHQANFRLVMADGDVKHVSQTSRYLSDRDGSGKLVGTLQDVSEQVSSERNLQLSQRMDAVGQMAGGIAHDFNNLLGIVMGNLDMLALKLKDDEKNKKRVDTAMSAASRGSDLTRKLLNFSRSTPQNVDAIDTNEVLHGMRELLDRSVTPAIRIETALSDGLWLANIDPTEFENAILNLVINARDAIGQNPGLIVIETSNVKSRSGSKRKGIEPVLVDSVEIAVSDNGGGMPPEVADRVFEPFFSTKTSSKGTGLGLAMVYGFVERHNGSIRVESELKSGTTFTIMLPRAEGQVASSRRVEGPDSLEVPTGEERVLVVDDELELGEIAGAYLEDAGYTVEIAGNAAEALDKLRRSPFDLLFSDIIMPGKLNGVQLAETVKRKYPGTLVLLTSGFTANALESDLMKNYKDLLLPKPYRREQLLKRVRSVLDGT